jgi:hypothetical protein
MPYQNNALDLLVHHVLPAAPISDPPPPHLSANLLKTHSEYPLNTLCNTPFSVNDKCKLTGSRTWRNLNDRPKKRYLAIDQDAQDLGDLSSARQTRTSRNQPSDEPIEFPGTTIPEHMHAFQTNLATRFRGGVTWDNKRRP